VTDAPSPGGRSDDPVSPDGDADRPPSPHAGADDPASPGAGAADPTSLTVRPPRGPLVAVAVIAVLTAPLALVAVAFGDVVLGVLAVLSAAWAGSLAYLGWTARAHADVDGVEVTWMRSTSRVEWAHVVAVEVDDGAGWGSGRGALIRVDDGSTVRWTPWLPILWFAARSARLSVGDLADVVAVASRRKGRPIHVRRISEDDEQPPGR
jgi:hypothetical protein